MVLESRALKDEGTQDCHKYSMVEITVGVLPKKVVTPLTAY